VLLFEDLLLGAFKGAAEQLATATAGIFDLWPGCREQNDLSPQTSKNTRFILFLCFTRFLYALYSFMVYSPIMRFTLLSISSIKSSTLWASRSQRPNFGKGTSCVAYLTLKFTISVGAQP
jgi:hypothetical protein